MIFQSMNNDLLKSIKITPLLDSLKLENIDDDTYFGSKYKNRLSNSRLGLLKTKGVKAFFEGLKSEYSSSFDFGSHLHELYLQPDSFKLIPVYKPTAKAGLLADYLYSSEGIIPTDDDIKSASYKVGYYKDKLTPNRLVEFRKKAEPYWRDRYLYEKDNPPIEGENRIYTDENSYQTLCNCLSSLNDNTDIYKLIHPDSIVNPVYSANEHTILIDIQVEIPGHEPVIYPFKSKLDNFTIDKDISTITVNDLKTTSRPVDMFDLTYFSYQRELAIYSWLLKFCSEKYFGLANPTIKGNFFVVSTVPPNDTAIYPMTPQLFKSGFEEFKYLLRIVAYYNIIEGYEFS